MSIQQNIEPLTILDALTSRTRGAVLGRLKKGQPLKRGRGDNKIYLLHPLRVEVTSMNSFRMDTASSDLHTRYTKERERERLWHQTRARHGTNQPSGLALAGR